MPLINTAMLAASASAGSPTVYTLTLDNLLTRYHFGRNQQFAVQVTTNIGGPNSTTPILLDGAIAIKSVEDIATELQTALTDLAQVGLGQCVVSGISNEAGDQYVFTVEFDASLNTSFFDFYNATSQWYPTIALVETVDSEGVADDPGSPEIVTISPTTSNTSYNYTQGGSPWSSLSSDENTLIASVDTPTGWTLTAGGVGSASATFTCNTPGNVTDVAAADGGGISITQGSDPVSGSPEVHTITPQPVNPTGGTWKPGVNGSEISFSQDSPSLENNAIATGSGWIGGTGTSLTSGTTLASGAVQFTNGDNGNVGDLGPVNVSLTAPEITHSITPA